MGGTDTVPSKKELADDGIILHRGGVAGLISTNYGINEETRKLRGTNVPLDTLRMLANSKCVEKAEAVRTAARLGLDERSTEVFVEAMVDGETCIDIAEKKKLFRSPCAGAPEGVEKEESAVIIEPAETEELVPPAESNVAEEKTTALIAEAEPAEPVPVKLPVKDPVEKATPKTRKKIEKRQSRDLTAKEWKKIFSDANDLPYIKLLEHIFLASGKSTYEVSEKMGKSRSYLKILLSKSNFCPDKEVNDELTLALEIPEEYWQRLADSWEEFKSVHPDRRKKEQRLIAKSEKEKQEPSEKLAIIKGKEFLEKLRALDGKKRKKVVESLAPEFFEAIMS